MIQRIKHDAHVWKFRMQFFPFYAFLATAMIFFMFGLLLGQIWGFESCYNFKSLLGSVDICCLKK